MHAELAWETCSCPSVADLWHRQRRTRLSVIRATAAMEPGRGQKGDWRAVAEWHFRGPCKWSDRATGRRATETYRCSADCRPEVGAEGAEFDAERRLATGRLWIHYLDDRRGFGGGQRVGHPRRPTGFSAVGVPRSRYRSLGQKRHRSVRIISRQVPRAAYSEVRSGGTLDRPAHTQ